MELKGKTAVITGGTKGIGRSIAEALVREGVNVCVCARKEEELVSAVHEIGEMAEVTVTGVVCDVRNYDAVKGMFDHASSELGGVDILVNNAGIGKFQTVEAMTPGDFRAILETNLFGVFYCCH